MALTLHQPRSHSKRLQDFILLLIGCAMLGGGIYLGFLTLTPELYMQHMLSDWNTPVVHEKKQLTENRLYIPEIKLNIPYKTGDESVLNENVWHRFPERGDPKKGGNFILAGHRFQLGFSPGETLRTSPFYHFNRLAVGQSLYVDFEGVRYRYEITKRYPAQATALNIEAPSDTPKLTVYTCDLFNPKEIREVVEATQVEKDVDPSLVF